MTIHVMTVTAKHRYMTPKGCQLREVVVGRLLYLSIIRPASEDLKTRE